MAAETVVLVNATGVRSGAENVLVRVAESLVDSGMRIVVVSPEGPVVSAFPAGTQHIAVDTLGLEGRRGAARLVGVARVAAAWFRAGRVLRRAAGTRHTVVVNSLFALPALACAFPRGHRAGLTTWLVHDTVVSRKQRIAVRLGAGRLDRAVAVSEVTAAAIRSMVPEVVVRPNGVTIPEVVVTSRERERVVGILAALTPWKGHDVLLEAVALIPEAILEIAGGELPGDAGYAGALRNRAERPDLRGRVRFLGHVDRGEVLSRWAVAVSASILPEAGPLGVLECMAAGLPVIATDHGGAGEYLSGGVGVLVPPGDAASLARALERLLSDDELRDEMARAARSLAEQRHDIARTMPAMVGSLTKRQPVGPSDVGSRDL